MKKIFLALFSVAIFSSATNPHTTEKSVDYNVAIETAIADFLKCRLSKKSNVFSLGFYRKGEFDTFEISNDMIVVSIGPVDNADTFTWFDDMLGKDITYHPYYITLADTLGSTRLPTRHIIKDGKLFYWIDPNYGLTEDMIKILLEYNLAERIHISDISYLGLIGKHEDFVKVADYYFCKSDLNNYKRVISYIAIGWYKPPKLRCNH